MADNAVQILLIQPDANSQVMVRQALQQSKLASRAAIVASASEVIARISSDQADALNNVCMIVMTIDAANWTQSDVITSLKADPRVRFIPLIVLGAKTDSHLLQQVYDAGANSYIVSTFDTQGVAEKLSQWASYWIALNQRPGIWMQPGPHAQGHL